MIYLYGVSDSPNAPPVQGLRGAPLSVTGEDGLFAAWSEHADARFEAAETALWEHERVVEALLEQGTVLPMRFGSGVRDREALLDLLAARRLEFELGIERVRGAVEIGVRALIRGESPEPAPALTGADRPGTAYMLARLNGEKRSAAIAAQIHEPLAALSRASTPGKTSLNGSVNTAYLVELGDVEPFRSAVEALDAAVDDATIVCTGPWPPYSFTPAEVTQ